MNCSPPGSSIHGVSQARILKWGAISFSRGFPWQRDSTRISCFGRQILYCWAVDFSINQYYSLNFLLFPINGKSSMQYFILNKKAVSDYPQDCCSKAIRDAVVCFIFSGFTVHVVSTVQYCVSMLFCLNLNPWYLSWLPGRDNCVSSFSSVESLSHVWLFATAWTAACQASLSITNSQSLLKLMSIQPSHPLFAPYSDPLQSTLIDFFRVSPQTKLWRSTLSFCFLLI